MAQARVSVLATTRTSVAQLRQFFVTIPVPLLASVRCRDDLARVLAYCLTQRQEAEEATDNEKLPRLDFEEIMDDLQLRFDFDTDRIPELAEQAEQFLSDFREHNVERSPSAAKIPWALVCDAYAGNLSLPYFLVYAAISSQFAFDVKRAWPKEISAAKILRLIHGYSTRKSYDDALLGERVTVRLSIAMIRYISKRLALRGLVDRFTACYRGTWYSMPWLTKYRKLDLPSYVAGVIARRKAKARAYEAAQVRGNILLAEKTETLLREYRQVIDTDRKAIGGVPYKQAARETIEAVFEKFPSTRAYTVDELTGRTYNARAYVEQGGMVRVLLQEPSKEMLRALTAAGATVKRCQK